MLRFFAWLVLVFCIISVAYSAYIKLINAWRSARKMLARIKSAKTNFHGINTKGKIKKLNRQQLTTFFLDLITLNSRTKRAFVFYSFPIAVLLSIPSGLFRYSRFTSLLGDFFVVITLLGLAKFLGRNFNGCLFDKINVYLSKLSIFIVYSLSFFVGYLQNPRNDVFFVIALLTTIVFSVYFLKSIIDGFEHIGFSVFNFFMVYLYDILAIGLYFGFYYLQNNTIFKLYTNTHQFDSFSSVALLSIIQIGLSNFYSLSNPSLGLESVKNFVPLFEYLLGAIFNAGIIGFFISYMASKIFKTLDNKKS